MSTMFLHSTSDPVVYSPTPPTILTPVCRVRRYLKETQSSFHPPHRVSVRKKCTSFQSLSFQNKAKTTSPLRKRRTLPCTGRHLVPGNVITRGLTKRTAVFEASSEEQCPDVFPDPRRSSTRKMNPTLDPSDATGWTAWTALSTRRIHCDPKLVRWRDLPSADQRLAGAVFEMKSIGRINGRERTCILRTIPTAFAPCYFKNYTHHTHYHGVSILILALFFSLESSRLWMMVDKLLAPLIARMCAHLIHPRILH